MSDKTLVASFVSSSFVLGCLGVSWSDWFLLAGAVGAAAAAAWYATHPTKS